MHYSQLLHWGSSDLLGHCFDVVGRSRYPAEGTSSFCQTGSRLVGTGAQNALASNAGAPSVERLFCYPVVVGALEWPGHCSVQRVASKCVASAVGSVHQWNGDRATSTICKDISVGGDLRSFSYNRPADKNEHLRNSVSIP